MCWSWMMIPMYAPPLDIFVICGVHAVKASVNNPVVANMHKIHVSLPTLTVATRLYRSEQKQVQQWPVSAKSGQKKVTSNMSRIGGVSLAFCGHVGVQEALLGSTPYCIRLLRPILPVFFSFFFIGV